VERRVVVPSTSFGPTCWPLLLCLSPLQLGSKQMRRDICIREAWFHASESVHGRHYNSKTPIATCLRDCAYRSWRVLRCFELCDEALAGSDCHLATGPVRLCSTQATSAHRQLAIIIAPTMYPFLEQLRWLRRVVAPLACDEAQCQAPVVAPCSWPEVPIS
jgi:hypothetical protein